MYRVTDGVLLIVNKFVPIKIEGVEYPRVCWAGRSNSKAYNKDHFAVSGLSLNVDSGDLFAFIGHNGAGKSTTIKSIVGILPFDDGDILIDGISIKKDPIACKKMIAYIPDNPDIYEL